MIIDIQKYGIRSQLVKLIIVDPASVKAIDHHKSPWTTRYFTDSLCRGSNLRCTYQVLINQANKVIQPIAEIIYKAIVVKSVVLIIGHLYCISFKFIKYTSLSAHPLFSKLLPTSPITGLFFHNDAMLSTISFFFDRYYGNIIFCIF